MHYTLHDAVSEAREASKRLMGEEVRVIAFDYKAIFEGEVSGTRYAVVNTECTFEEMAGAGYVNARICVLISEERS